MVWVLLKGAVKPQISAMFFSGGAKLCLLLSSFPLLPSLGAISGLLRSRNTSPQFPILSEPLLNDGYDVLLYGDAIFPFPPFGDGDASFFIDLRKKIEIVQLFVLFSFAHSTRLFFTFTSTSRSQREEE
mmetsp:Transcript_30113/g.38668  ORF Transcript_30113/g.38668 Transcript_30113/m.38668 type:complete len:129 (-) Transcript_30113:65-451(-)